MTEEEIKSAKEMEHHFRELRLAEHAFFRESFKDIKTKYRRYLIWIFSICSILVFLWSLFSCSWLHKIGLCASCAMHHLIK